MYTLKQYENCKLLIAIAHGVCRLHLQINYPAHDSSKLIEINSHHTRCTDKENGLSHKTAVT